MRRKGNFAAIVKEKTPHGMDALSVVIRFVPIELCVSAFIDVVGPENFLDWPIFVRHNYIYVTEGSMSAKGKDKAAKIKALLEEGTLNPAPEKVRDPKFRETEFFDPHDIVQVKYEMLRRVSMESASVADTAEEYGVSRPTYYQTKAQFTKCGVAGLVPQKRGPRGPHKLQGDALAFVEQQRVAGEPVRARVLAKLIQQKFDLRIHPRTIERAVAGKKTVR
jgi:transposase